VGEDRKENFQMGNSVRALFFLLTLGVSGFAQNFGADLPSGVLKALAGDRREYCEQVENRKDCRKSFEAHLIWQRLRLSPKGKTGILVENQNVGFCGSDGCALRLFVAIDEGRFVQVLGTQGDIGSLRQVKTLESVTKGYLDLRKVWSDGKSYTDYRWSGTRYTSK
jgi:hypothetical protein